MVLDQGVLAQGQAVLAQDQEAMVLGFILLEVKDWAKESHPNQVGKNTHFKTTFSKVM